MSPLGHSIAPVLLQVRSPGRCHIRALADRIRAEAATTVAALRAVTAAEPVLLTGDHERAAAARAAEAGIADVRAGLLPQDQVTAVRELQADGRRVLLVGDGINDAAPIAGADVGVAMAASARTWPRPAPTPSSATTCRPCRP